MAKKKKVAKSVKKAAPKTSRKVSTKKASTKKVPTKKVPTKKTATKGARTSSKTAAKSSSKAAPPRTARASVEVSGGSGVSEGDKAPDFRLPDQDGNEVASADLAGQAYVLYFYPRDDTPGCTVEACAFRDMDPDFSAASVRVVGVSPDTEKSHAKFRSKYGLPFTLLADTERSLAQKYGVWAKKNMYGRETMGIIRSTFLVDERGVVRKVWRGVKVKGHADAVIAAARNL